MKLGFIGYGNMASAIVNGILAKGTVQPADILVYDHDEEKCRLAAAKGMIVAASAKKIAICAQTIFICVKPKDFTKLLSTIKSDDSSKIYVSIAAGITIASMQKALGTKAAIIRAMPNTPLLLGQGTTALCKNEYVSDDEFAFVREVFASAGTVYLIPENQFDHVINLNGSSPAYFYLICKTIAEYADKQGGIPLNTAIDMIADTMQGAGRMLKESGSNPEDLIKAVSSPGGTTVAALEAMKAAGLKESLVEGCEACVERSKEMGQT